MVRVSNSLTTKIKLLYWALNQICLILSIGIWRSWVPWWPSGKNVSDMAMADSDILIWFSSKLMYWHKPKNPNVIKNLIFSHFYFLHFHKLKFVCQIYFLSFFFLKLTVILFSCLFVQLKMYDWLMRITHASTNYIRYKTKLDKD